MAPALRVVKGSGAGRQRPDPGAFLDRLKELAPPEEWRAVPGWPGYEVSDRGRVRSRLRGRPRIKRPQKSDRGYLRVMLGSPGRRKHARVHCLVAAAFIGPCPDGYTVDHLDRNKRNNRPGNLEYVTRLENYRRHLRRAREALQDVLDMFASPVRQAVAS